MPTRPDQGESLAELNVEALKIILGRFRGET
jgi:hypothetical protein